MAFDLSIFKDYDVRGIYPKQFNGQVAEEVGYAIAAFLKPKSVAIVRDMRLSGPEIRDALVKAFMYCGIDVFDAGLGGTEMSYFIAGTKPYDLVLMISASHNPSEYNGLKVVKRGPIAVTGSSGLADIKNLVGSAKPTQAARVPGKVTTIDIMNEWKEKVLSLVDTSVFTPLTVVVDAGNGMGGVLVKKVFEKLPFKTTYLNYEPDGSFPNHVPNPLIDSNNAQLVAKVKELKADLGLTFDGDADRMFLIDDTGRFVSGTITTALLARYFLKKYPGESILYNAICGRVVPEIITKSGGKGKRVRVGHSYIKTYMKETGAVFAGEHSGHYYHRDFFTAESGVLTALMILGFLCIEKKKLSTFVKELDVYPASGEINFVSQNIPSAMEAIKKAFPDATSIDELDGISIWYTDWWCNVRASKTEPYMRLNVEADNAAILKEKTELLVSKIEALGGKRK